MDPDRPNPADRGPLDDAALAALVRDVADDWHLPPQRLDGVTWRDRVGRGRGPGDGGSGVRWTRRLIGAATIAVVATVSLSFAAVWLTAPRGDQGVVGASGSPSPSHGASSAGPSASPMASSTPASSPLPRLVQNGDLPTPSKVMVSVAQRYHLVDLAAGTLGPASIDGRIGFSSVLARPGGGWICLCGTGYSPQAVQLSLVRVDPDGFSPDLPEAGNGNLAGAPRLKDLQGTFDPNESVAMQPSIAGVNVTTTPDQRFALIGWIYRDGAAGWVLGVDVLDLETLEVTSTKSVTLDAPVAVDGHGRVQTAPVASVSADGSTMLLSSFWYIDLANTAAPGSGTDHWTASFRDGVIGPDNGKTALTAAGSTSDTDCGERDAGAIDKGGYYRLCGTPMGLGQYKVARVGLDGTLIDTTDLPTPLGMLLTTRTADALFIWSPEGRSIIRFDLRTAEVITNQGTALSTPNGLTDRVAALGRQLGRFIAPPALAKVWIEPGIVASPDGRRIFALGMAGPDGVGSSTGVDVFDAATLESLGHWAPTAPYLSLAINADGTAVYAAAPGGIAPDGSGSPDNGASITVFDSASGDVRLLAGQLGQPGTSTPQFLQSVLR